MSAEQYAGTRGAEGGRAGMRPAVFLVASVSTALAYLALSNFLALISRTTNPVAVASVFEGKAESFVLVGERLAPPLLPQEKSPSMQADASAALRALAAQEIAREPLSRSALAMRARAQQIGPQPQGADAFWKQSYARSFRDLETALQLFQKSLQKPDFGAAIEYADAVLRTSPQFFDSLAPALSAIADQPDARKPLIEMMRSQPPWRALFLRNYAFTNKNEDAFMQVFIDLKGSPQELRTDEVAFFSSTLAARGKVEQARYIWLNMLSEDQLGGLKPLFNGDFRLPVNDFPFNWTIASTPSANVQIAAGASGSDSKALQIEFTNQRGDFQHVSQTLSLHTGGYRLSGTYRGDDFRNPRGLVWRLTCEGATGTPIAESAMLRATSGSPAKFEMDFQIPGKDCEWQTLRLHIAARIPMEQAASGMITFENLAVESR